MVIKNCIICGTPFRVYGTVQTCSMSCRSNANKEKRRAKNSKYRAANAEKIKASKNTYYYANIEKVRERIRKQRANHRLAYLVMKQLGLIKEGDFK